MVRKQEWAGGRGRREAMRQGWARGRCLNCEVQGGRAGAGPSGNLLVCSADELFTGAAGECRIAGDNPGPFKTRIRTQIIPPSTR